MSDPAPATLPSETGIERRNRLAWEADGIARAHASVAEGRLIDEAKVDAWIDSLGTDYELPAPCAPR